MSDVGERINGGAVMDERSPEKDAILCVHRHCYSSRSTDDPRCKVHGAHEWRNEWNAR